MKKAIMVQVIIFVVAWFVMTPDTLEDNTHLFGLFGDVEVIKGNSIWVLAGAAVLSVLNIWVWWPRTQKVINTPETAKESEDTKSAETDKAIDQDPKTPTLD